jgi:hypothetical protein
MVKMALFGFIYQAHVRKLRIYSSNPPWKLGFVFLNFVGHHPVSAEMFIHLLMTTLRRANSGPAERPPRLFQQFLMRLPGIVGYLGYPLLVHKQRCLRFDEAIPHHPLLQLF